MKIIIFIVLLGCFAFSQTGISLQELKQNISKYFDEALISDLDDDLPSEGSFNIYGWDVGDFSGDGYFDLAFALREFGRRDRKIKVYLFADVEGYLVNVNVLEKEFVEIPLEVGVVIKNGNCYLTEKFKQFHWRIEGYNFNNGAFSKVDEFVTEKIKKFTKETYVNFQNLNRSERYVLTSNGKEQFRANYLIIPSYPRGEKIYKGFENELESNDIEYVHKGAFDWEGSDDASFNLRSAHDNDYLYLTISVQDDNLVVPSCDDCVGDYIDVWFNMNELHTTKSKFVKDIGFNLEMEELPKDSIYKFSIYLGDFTEKRPYVNLNSSEDLTAKQKLAANSTKAISKVTDEGYVVKFKVPFQFFGFEDNPINSKPYNVEYGCSVVVHDIDNEFRPEEETQIASSKFESNSPSSYGSLILLNKNQKFGESTNIYKGQILKYLKEYGL